ncbi:MAG: hypothetical protein AAGO57_07575, partial [Pseudomonadota bacterium]
LAFTAFAVWRKLSGWWLRGLAFAALLVGILNPSVQMEERETLTDLVVLIVDETSSQRISDRSSQTAEAISEIEAKVARLGNTELRVKTLGDADANRGSLIMGALAEAMAKPEARQCRGSDRRLKGSHRPSAPAFAIIGEPVTLTLMVEDQGAAPGETTAPLEISIDGGEPEVFEVPIGQALELPLTLPHGGLNVVQFTVPTADGELTDRNNSAVVQINGVRDRLRVLLVSGEPHAGERTWRNLLKADASVDLVHFTILRPPEKQDGVPVSELSLIAFPTRELFLDKIDEFDLIIFDRYKRRGILPAIYLDNVRAYVEEGGAVLVAAGPDFAGAESIYRSPLAEVLPATPTGIVVDQGFVPDVTDLGDRHPVTEGLEALGPGAGDPESPAWGRWLRLIDLEADGGQVVIAGPDDRPLLVLERKGEGRVALLGSDHAWLWSRGYEGGGPQLELLRRLAHWMMGEPELDEEALRVSAEGQRMTITRRSLGSSVGEVEITGPDGTVTLVPLEETSPGRFTAEWEAPEIGLYRLIEGEEEAVIALGPAAPREFEQTIASGDVLAPAVEASRGGILAVEDGVPDLRRVREGRPAAGRGWIGITPREAYLTADISVTPILPAWGFLLLACALAIGAWLREGRQ